MPALGLCVAASGRMIGKSRALLVGEGGRKTQRRRSALLLCSSHGNSQIFELRSDFTSDYQARVKREGRLSTICMGMGEVMRSVAL